jgi:hypothetical protein
LSDELLAEPFRPLPIRGLNAIGRTLVRFGQTPIALDEAALLEAARRQTGLSDFGPESFRPGLRKLLDSLERDARLTLFGRYFARRQVLELLSHRLLLTEHRKRHPEVAAQPIRQPLFILGLPRTGTTLLYGLLAEDPAHRAPLSWEVDQPCPPAETATYETDPRIEISRKRFEQLAQLAPGIQAIHPVGALMPQECIVLTASEFMSIRFEMCFDVASYQDWLLDQDMYDAYAHHRRFLQHMQSRHAGERWILKSPGHLGPLDALFDTYPDALVVQTHRDPLRVIPSVASLEYTLRMVSTDDLDPHALGRQQLRAWSTLLEQGMAARAAHPEREPQILDLAMDEIVRDPLGSVERIYRHFDLELRGETRARMERYLARHPKNQFGSHRYRRESFGLDEATVNEVFKGYRERFGVPVEARRPSPEVPRGLQERSSS